MYEIIGLGSEPKQKVNFILDGDNSGSVELVWMNDYLTWFMNIELNDEKIYGIRLCNSYSLLKNYTYKKFDVLCSFPDDVLSVDPSSMGRDVKLYIILESEFSNLQKIIEEMNFDYIEKLNSR